MGGALAAVGQSTAIAGLLDVGAIQGSFLRVTDELIKRSDLPPEHLIEYRITGVGEALMEFAARELHLSSIDPTSFS